MRVQRPAEGLSTDEVVVAVVPAVARDVDADWRRRLHLLTGRSLTERGLETEQAHRAGGLASLGQYLAPGVVTGLEAELVAGSGDVRIRPGLGIAESGEDVVLPREIVIALSSVPIWDDAAGPGAGPFVLVLEPVLTHTVADVEEDDPCEVDPARYPYEDRTLTDAVRLWRVRWPAGWALPTGDRMRNDLAYEVFAREAAGETGPWAAVGVAIGLVAELAGAPFLDRHAVVRRGGFLGPSRSGGGAALFHARFEQWLAHLVSIEPAALGPAGLETRVRHLPPVGALPADAFPLRVRPGGTATEDPFPEAWSLLAEPVPFESLDDVFRASCALAPLSLEEREQVEVLVPVPTASFDPELLVIAEVDAEFFDTRYRMRKRLFDLLLARGLSIETGTARRYAFALHRVLGGQNRVFPESADRVPDEDVRPVPPAGTEEVTTDIPLEDLDVALRAELVPLETRLTTILGGDRIRQFIETIAEPAAGRTPLDATRPFPDEFGWRGLDGAIRELDDRIRRADDRLDVGFIRIQADVYRIKQYVGENVAGTRLATSPALGILARSVLDAPTHASLQAFATTLAADVRSPPPASSTPTPSPSASTPSPAGSGTVAFEGTPLFIHRAVGERNASTSTREMLRRVALLEEPAEEPNFAFMAMARDRPLTNDLFLSLVASRPLEESPPPPISYGTYTIRDRFRAPPATEANRFSLESKVAALEAIADVHEELGLDLGGIAFPGFVDGGTTASTRTIEQILHNGRELITSVAAGTHDFPKGTDEASFYAAGAKSLEDAVAILRAAEGRAASYKRARAALVEARERIRLLGERGEAQLDRIEDDLVEARQDVRVVETLLAEETARIEAANARRDRVVAEEVPYLVFRRPRTLALDVELPRAILDAALPADPLPACANEDVEAPDELRDMVDLLRDAPIAWLPPLRPWLDRIDRLDTLHQTVAHAVTKARLAEPERRDAFRSDALGVSVFGQPIRAAFELQRRAIGTLRAETAAFDLGTIASAAWGEIRRRAEHVVTVGDLVDARHGRRDAGAAAAAELDRIYRIASCLYARFREVPALLRLRWAERHSQLDAPVVLRDLTALENWPRIDRDDRHHMQQLVDWLFGRIDGTKTEAVRVTNDLVRVALLLSAHAPVNKLLEAEIVAPQPTRPGGFVRVAIDPGLVRIGMPVLLYGAVAGQAVGRGVVADLGGGRVEVSVVESATQIITPLRAQLGEPTRRPSSAGAFGGGAFPFRVGG
jgi:hypothetical protein